MTLAVGVLAGCGDDEDDAARSQGRVTVRVGILPIADSAPLYLGMKQGFFADEDLEVKPQLVASGAIAIPAVVRGEFQFGWTNSTSLIIARSRGLPLRFVSGGSVGGSGPAEGSSAIFVSNGGPITSAKQLEGKTISVPALNSISTLTANAALEKRGVDISTVKYIEVPFPQAIAALERGRVDAAFVAEPFITLGMRAGHRIVSHPISETARDYAAAAFFTTDEYIAEHGDVVERFARAVNRSLDYAIAHPAQVRAVLPTYTEVPPRIAQAMRLSEFSRGLDETSLQLTVDLAKKYGYIKRTPRISELVHEPS